MPNKTVLHNLASGMVLDRSMLILASIADIESSIATIRAANGKPLYLIDGAENFFTPQKLISLIAEKDKRSIVVNEGLDHFFTDKQMAALANQYVPQDGAVIKPAAVNDPLIVNLGDEVDHLKEKAAGDAPGYQFAPVPDGWNINTHMSLGPTKIKRKIKNSDGDGVMFYMSPGDYEKLWTMARNAWAQVEDAPLVATFMTSMGKLKATIQDDRISLGGNYVRRYEIEQVAKHRNWLLPHLLAA